MRMRSVALLAVLLAAAMPGAGQAKGYGSVVLVGADGSATHIRGNDRELDAWVDLSAAPRQAAGGYLRLFFVGRGGFPANPARYYPRGACVALDWPSYETVCHPLRHALADLFQKSGGLPRFATPPTIPVRLTYLGQFTGLLKTAGALAGPLELALDRKGHRRAMSGSCFRFTADWNGPAASLRPHRFRLCPGGIYAGGVLHPLNRGVWAWFDLNVD